MGLFSLILTFPVSAPLKSALWTIEKVHDLAREQYDDPAFIRRELAALEEKLLAGEITEAAFEAAELELIERLEAAEGQEGEAL